MNPSFVLVPNAEGAAVDGGTAIVAQVTILDLLDASPLSATDPIAGRITRFPAAAAGLIRVRCGPGTTSLVMALRASEVPYMPPRQVALAISGAGDYFWPPGRLSLATNLTAVSGPAPGGAVNVDLLRTSGRVAGAKATAVLGVLKAGLPVVPGGILQVVTGGPATSTASGPIKMGDELITAAGGRLQSRGGAVGVDVVGDALADAVDGEVFALNVNKRAV